MRPLLPGLALALAAAGLVQAAPIDAFTPEAASRFTAEQAPRAASPRTALAAAERLRAGLVLNPRAFMATQEVIEREALEGAFGRIGDREATHLAFYFRGALARSLTPDGGTVLFYNPLSDVAALTDWRRIDGDWRLVQARLIRGDALRDADDGYWADQSGVAYREALRVRSRGALNSTREYRRAYAPALEVLRQRSNSLQVGLAAWRSDPDQLAASERIRQSLASARNPAPVGPGSDQLQALSPDIRRTLALTAVFRRPDGDSLAFVSPLQPGLLIFVDLDAGRRAMRTGAVNLANLQD